MRDLGRFMQTPVDVYFSVDDEGRKAAEKFRQKRRTEIVRRGTEAALLVVLGAIICLDPKVRRVLWFWKRGKECIPHFQGSS